jgi:hypothetical protein
MLYVLIRFFHENKVIEIGEIHSAECFDMRWEVLKLRRRFTAKMKL